MGIVENYKKFLHEFEDHLSLIKKKAILIGVSKTKPLSDILDLYSVGHRDFGENYAQELRDKIKNFPSSLQGVNWHYIGQLQRNKVKYIAGKTSLIHTVDDIKKADFINDYCVSRNLIQPILLQVNISCDSSKAGSRLEDVGQLYSKALQLSGLEIKGLMTITKYSSNPEDSRNYYKTMKQLAMDLENKHGKKLELSMGMSNDYKVALDEGATMVRVGTKIFGERLK